MPDNPTQKKGPVNVDWEKVAELSDGRKVGHLQGFWYLLNDDGEAVSDGYHRITRDTMSYTGHLGSETTSIEPDDMDYDF